jgi:Flp pilus assembly protein TadG
MTPRRRRRGESGQTIAFVVGITLALLLLIGLTVDGGRILSARERALDEAQEAARVAAQQLDQAALRATGVAIVNQADANRAVHAYLQATGDTGSISVQGSDVQVSVQHSLGMDILSLVGIGTVTISETGTAHASQGTVVGT